MLIAMPVRVGLLLLLALYVAGCSTQKVQVESKQSADLLGGRVAWANPPLKPNAQSRDTSIYRNDQMIRQWLRTEFEARGKEILAAGVAADWLLDYRLVEAFSPDKNIRRSPREFTAMASDNPGSDPHALSPDVTPGKDDWLLQMQLIALSPDKRFIRRAWLDDIKSEEGLSGPPTAAVRKALRRVLDRLLEQ